MEKNLSRTLYSLFQIIAITAGLVFIILFIENIWIHHQVSLPKTFGYILFFSALNFGLLSDSKKTRHIIIAGIIAAIGALLILG